MKWINTKNRTQDAEIMDDFSLEGEKLRQALDKIAQINNLLGGNALTLQGVEYFLEKVDKDREITIIDVGCGNGDMLRVLSEYAYKQDLKMILIGVDANKFTIDYAEQLSKGYSDISFKCIDVFGKEYRNLECDIALCTLTLHHFKDHEIKDLMQTFDKQAAMGIIINDLQRSIVAYRLFQIVSYVLGLNDMARHDGLTSIRRGFRKKELEKISRELNFKNFSVHWKWAFRYQWIISKL